MAATTMFDLAVPGHERDMLEDLHYTTHVEPLGFDVVGFDDAKRELDALAVREYAAADEFMPTLADERIAFIATLG